MVLGLSFNPVELFRRIGGEKHKANHEYRYPFRSENNPQRG